MKATIVLILFVLSFSACRIIKPQTDTVKTDTTFTTYKQTEVSIAGAMVGASANLDSLKAAYERKITRYRIDSAAAAAAGKAIPQKPEPDKRTFTDPATKAQLTYWMDEYGKLQITCESKEQVVSLLTAEVTRLSKEVTKITEVAFKTPVWCWVVIGVLSTLLAISLILNIILKRK